MQKLDIFGMEPHKIAHHATCHWLDLYAKLLKSRIGVDTFLYQRRIEVCFGLQR